VMELLPHMSLTLSLLHDGFDVHNVNEGASVTLRQGGRAVTLPATCREEVVFATPRDYLLGLLPARAP